MAHALGLIAHLCASSSSLRTSISKCIVIARSNRPSSIASIIRIFKSNITTDKCSAVNKSVIWPSPLSSDWSPYWSSMMHISTSMHSSAHHPLAAFSLRIYYKAVIYGHAHSHSTECDCSQNYSSFSCRTVSALIAIAIAWWTLIIHIIPIQNKQYKYYIEY